MPALSVIPVAGQVRITARANLRMGDPSTAAPVVRKLEAGTPFTVTGIVIGQSVEGNAHWYRTGGNAYVWSGACGPFETLAPASATLSSAPPATSPQGGLPLISSPTGRSVPIVVDIYHRNRVESFATARNAGVHGIIHKASTGATGRDEAYADRRQRAVDAGMLWGAYHWGTSRPIDQQVENFLSAARPDDRTLVALDFEDDPGNQMTLAGAREFLERIEQKLGRKAVLYSANTIKGALGNSVDAFFGSHRLWLAQYGPTPRVQASWSTYWLWQYTDGTAGPGPRSAPGLPGNALGNLDCNHYKDSPEQLAAEWAS
jgi:lysozyme